MQKTKIGAGIENVQGKKGATTKTKKKWEYFNINVTQGVENMNASSMCCPRLIKREKRMENVKN